MNQVNLALALGILVSAWTPNAWGRDAYIAIPALSYDSMSGVVNGSAHVGYIDSGDWIVYRGVDFGTGASSASLSVAVDSSYAGKRIELRLDSRTAMPIGTLVVAGTGGWSSFASQSVPVSGATGLHDLYLTFSQGTGPQPDGIGNLQSLQFTRASTGGSSTPYTTLTVPGRIEAESFDNGGAGVAYSDTSAGNSGDFTGRGGDVDLQWGSGGTANAGWIASGEWLQYTVAVTSGGTYDLVARVAGFGGAFTVQVDGAPVASSVPVPNTGGWQSWTNVTRSGIALAAGTHRIRFIVAQSGFNFDYLELKAASSGASPYVSVNLPGRIEAENFDNGGQGVAYSDASGGNEGGYTARGGDVDLELGSGSGADVGWTSAGEWLQYTVNAPTGGTFDLVARVAGYGGAFTIQVDGSPVATGVPVPDTGGWQNWTSVTRSGIALSAGTHRIRFVVAQAGFNFDYLEIRAPAPITSTASFRLVAFNVAHGDAGIDAQTKLIAAQRPDVVVLEEIPNYSAGESLQYRDRLAFHTGQTWYYVQAIHNYSGLGDGNMILSRFQPVGQETRSLGPNSWADMRNSVRADLSIGGVRVNVFAVHLDWPSDSYLQTNMNTLLDWASGVGGRKIIAGDYNAWYKGTATQQNVIRQIRQQYSDSLVEFYGSDDAVPGTHDNGWRPDASYHGSGVRTDRVQVIPTSLSDHALVVVDYTLN
jgi:endonuclease/exonuclease/phosphatase family metal-dependent hydrolase